MTKSLVISLVLSLATTSSEAATTIYLNKSGADVSAKDGHGSGLLPAFGGGSETWTMIVDCVKQQYSPFDVDVVTRKPNATPFITIVVGGHAHDVDLDDNKVNGISPYGHGILVANGVGLVFSKVGTGEKDVENICAAITHESSHIIGLDHNRLCGDVMSYDLNACGARKFIDRAAPCGETADRLCGNGDQTQNSYRLLAKLVGLRGERRADRQPEVVAERRSNMVETSAKVATWKAESDKLLAARRARRRK